MLWALHRYFRRALEQFGNGKDSTLTGLMVAHRIKLTSYDMSEAMQQFVKDIAAVLADPLLKDTKDPKQKAEELLDRLFHGGDEAYTSVRTLFCVMFLKGLICEYPLWCAMTRPKHPNDPLPSQDEIEAAAREFLDGTRSAGDQARDR
jgi:hypothetical protein